MIFEKTDFLFQARKQTYKIQKKKVAEELSSAIKDKSVTVLSSWLKVSSVLYFVWNPLLESLIGSGSLSRLCSLKDYIEKFLTL